MSGYRGHLLGATVAFGLFAGVLNAVFAVSVLPSDWMLFDSYVFGVSLLAITLLFALWPDVDTNSKGQDIFYAIFMACDVFLIVTQNFQAAAYLGMLAMLPIVGKHRGWTHSKVAMLVVPLPFLLFPYLYAPETPLIGLPFYAAAVVGYASHLILDRKFI